MANRPRVLCVDDERLVSEALTVHLQRHFDVTVAESGEEGLAELGRGPTFAVVLSDMRMPGMNGAEFLSAVLSRSPTTTRILLTGHADLEAALAAINQGRIFRFLMKPCPARAVVDTVAEGAEQHRLIHAEKELLEQTLAGSIRVLTDVLALASPLAFGRAARIEKRLSALCDEFEVREQWAILLSAPLYHLGFVSLSDGVAEKVYYGQSLAAAEQETVDRVPELSNQLLASIPRLGPVRDIILAVPLRFDGAGAPPGKERGEAIPLGARFLRAALDLDGLEAAGIALGEAIDALAERSGSYDPAVVAALAAVAGHRVRMSEVRPLPLAGLKPGMVLAKDIRLKNGTLLVARQLTVTPSVVARLKSIPAGSVGEPVFVQVG
jgi:response regulator RpfG family c-di-GMP phosphodiesterase